MWAILLPILTAGGYIIYEVVMMKWEDYQAYLAKQKEMEEEIAKRKKIESEGCTGGKYATYSAETGWQCVDFWNACPPGFLPQGGTGIGGSKNFGCVPPSMYCPPGWTFQYRGPDYPPACLPPNVVVKPTPQNLVQPQIDPTLACIAQYQAMGLTYQQALTLCLNRQVQATPPNLVQPIRTKSKVKVRVPKKRGGSPSRGGRGTATAHGRG